MSVNLFYPKRIVGIEIQGTGIWAAVFSRSRSGLTAEALLYEEAASPDQDALIQTLSDLVQGFGLSQTPAGMVINDPRILHRAFVFPRMSLKELVSVVPMEARKEFGVREGFEIVYEVNKVFKEEDLPRMEILAAAVPSELVRTSMQILEQSGLVPSYLCTIPFAERLAPSRSLMIEKGVGTARLHTTRKGIHLSVYCGDRFLFSRMLKKALDFGGREEEPKAEAAAEDLSQAGSDAASPFTSTAQDSAASADHPFDRLAMEVKRSFLYVRQQNREPVEKVWLSGEGAASSQLRSRLESELGLSVHPLDHLPGTYLEKDAAWQYDLCLGSALFPSSLSTGNLVPREIQRKARTQFLQRLGKAGLVAAAVLVLLVYVQLEWSLRQSRRALFQFQAGLESVNQEFSRRTQDIHAKSTQLVKGALAQGLTSEGVGFEDVLAALGLYTPSGIILEELFLVGGTDPFSMKITGRISLSNFSGGDLLLDSLLSQLKSSGVFRTVRGSLGSGEARSESGLMQTADSGSQKQIVFQALGD